MRTRRLRWLAVFFAATLSACSQPDTTTTDETIVPQDETAEGSSVETSAPQDETAQTGSVETTARQDVTTDTSATDTTASASGNFVAVFTSSHNSCGIRTDRTIECWGFGRDDLEAQQSEFNRLMSESEDETGSLSFPRLTREFVDPSTGEFIHLSLFADIACGVRTDRKIECWGGIGGSEFEAPPSSEFVSVSVGPLAACGVRIDQTIECWGSSIGHGPFDFPSPPESHGVTSVAVSPRFGCAVTNGLSAFCWPLEEMSALQWVSAFDNPQRTIESVHSGGWFTCVLYSDGEADCRYTNIYSGNLFASVAAGESVSCEAGGTFEQIVYECSKNANQSSSPRSVADDFSSISVGDSTACGIRADRTLECWGWITGLDVMGRIPSGEFQSVAVGQFHGCGVRTNGTIECWGSDEYDTYGQASPPA